MSEAKRVKTGLPILDKMSNEGLIEKDITLVSGEPGTGKSTLATMFLLEGIANGEPGVYISLEEKKDKFFNHMSSFGFDMRKHEKSGKLYFAEMRGQELKKLVEHGSQMFDGVIGKMRAKRVVIDSISAYAHAFSTDIERRNKIRDLFDTIDRWGVTALLTGEEEKPEKDYGVGYMVDATIHLKNIEVDKGKRDRYIEIIKMRGTKHISGRQYMQITQKGIVIKSGD
jgi:circadian clock protein KaiC